MALQLTTNDSYQEGDNRRFIDLLIEIERDLHVLAELRGIAGTQATKYEAGATYERHIKLKIAINQLAKDRIYKDV